MNYTLTKFDSTNPEHCEAARSIADLSAESGTIRTYQQEDIKTHPLGFLAFCEGGFLAGYIAIVEVEDTIPMEARVGAFAVAAKLQGNGVGSALINKITVELPQEMPDVTTAYAYVNASSQRCFESQGYSVAGERQQASSTGCNTIVSIQVQ